MSPAPVRIHLCFPCFNPEPADWVRLADYVAAVRGNLKAELLVTIVDDGSPAWVDPPADLLKGALAGARILRQPVNRGKGGAIKAAIAALPEPQPGAREVFAFTDFDAPYSVENLVGVCAAVSSGSADLCFGDRSFESSSRETRLRFSRLISHHVFRLFVRMLIAGGIFDTQCGLKAFRADLVRHFPAVSRIDGFLFDIEWIYIALHHRLVLRPWPVNLLSHHESSRLRFFGDLRLLRDLWTLLGSIAGRRYDSPQIRDWGHRERDRTMRALQ